MNYEIKKYSYRNQTIKDNHTEFIKSVKNFIRHSIKKYKMIQDELDIQKISLENSTLNKWMSRVIEALKKNVKTTPLSAQEIEQFIEKLERCKALITI